MYMNTELLAPAGSPEGLRAALYFGADAVYCGGPMLQLRAGAAAFSFEELAAAVEYTHSLGKKLYVTVNCFATNEEITLVGEYGKRLLETGVDAVIVSDLGVLAELREKCPELEVHISTQANTQNYKAIEMWHSLGAKRVVLGREMTMEQIEGLKGKIPSDCELEVFVHGAMCMAYSGRCLLSSFMNNRSGNRGQCSQPCRWSYYLVEEKRRNMFIPVIEEAGATAVLSSTDLKSISFLDRLSAAGISSFKIEGRMKSPYYVATVVNAYRQYMDGKASLDECDRELDCASHRPYASGFYFGEAKASPENDGLYRQSCSFIGIVLGETPDGGYTVEMRNRFKKGDVLEILSPHSMGEKLTVLGITGENGESKDEAVLVQEKVTMYGDKRLFMGDMLRKRI